MTRNLSLMIQFRLNLLRQALAQFHAPLVKAIDVPYRALRERDMFVIGDQGTQCPGCDLLCEDGGGGSVTEESFVWDELGGCAFGGHFFGGLANHEGFGLGKEVGCEHFVVLVILDRVVTLSRHDEVCWNELRALVKQLIKRMLRIGSWLSEQDSTCRILDVFATSCYAFPIRLHGKLLQIGGESVKVLIKGRYEMCLSPKEIRVPDTKQTAYHRNIFFFLLRGLS